MPSPHAPSEPTELARTVASGCTECRACQVRCAFLRESGTPKDHADHVLGGGTGMARAFECSLCGLCRSLCPMDLPLPELFLAMRRAALKNGVASLTPYRSLLNYEAIGASSLFRSCALPPGGDTVLFPGCTFPGAHPRTALALYRHLRAANPTLGLVLGCCFKPSHDLGREDFFASRFGTLRATLLSRGVRTVITACPNCFKVFDQYGEALAVRVDQARVAPARQRLVLKRLFDGFEGKLTSSKWAKLAKCSQDTAARDIDDLVGRGVLAKDAAGGRSTSYSLVA